MSVSLFLDKEDIIIQVAYISVLSNDIGKLKVVKIDNLFQFSSRQVIVAQIKEWITVHETLKLLRNDGCNSLADRSTGGI